MSASIDVVYRGGAFHPTTPTDLPEGTSASVIVQAPLVVSPMSPGRAAYEMMCAVAELPEEPGGDKTITGRDHDKFLYGGPKGAL